MLLVCLPQTAQAHQRLVGVIQATAVPGANRVTILLKLEVRALMAQVGLGEIADDDPRLLVTDKGRHLVLDLLRRTHEVESWSGVCERDRIDRLELTPSHAWLDIQITYRCPAPMHYVMVRLDTLLDEEGHRIVGDFDAGGGPERVLYNRRARRHFLLFDAAPPVEAPPPPVQAPPRWTPVLLHLELGLLIVVLAGGVGERRRRGLLAGAAMGIGVLAVALGAWSGRQWVPALSGLLGLVAVAGLCARGLVLRRAFSRADIVAAAFAAVLAGLAAARDGIADPAGVGVYAAVAVVGFAGLGFGAGVRGRQALGFGCLALLIFLGVGEAFRVV